MIEKFYVNESGVFEIIMSSETAEKVKIVMCAFSSGYELGSKGDFPTHKEMAEYVIENFLEDIPSKKLATENFFKFTQAIDKKVQEYKSTKK